MIKCWPTAVIMADDIGAPRALVRQWKKRNFIHPRWWTAIIASPIAEACGITLQQLAEIAAHHNNFGGRKRRRRRRR
jgi:hypothetical protein